MVDRLRIELSTRCLQGIAAPQRAAHGGKGPENRTRSTCSRNTDAANTPAPYRSGTWVVVGFGARPVDLNPVLRLTRTLLHHQSLPSFGCCRGRRCRFGEHALNYSRISRSAASANVGPNE